MTRNTIVVLISCHRVIRKNGEAGLYRSGAERKHAIIGWEQSRRIAQRETGLIVGAINSGLS